MGDINNTNIAKLMAKPRVHFGSIEESEAKRFKHDNNNEQDAIIQAASAGSSGIDFDALAELGQGSGALQGNEQVLAEFERRKRARDLAVPTDDGRVRQRLRDFGEPQCLFGEGPGERRDRLRYLLSQMADGGKVESEPESEDEDEEEFFTPGSQELLQARQFITTYSLPRAKERLHKQKLEVEIPLTTLKMGRKELQSKLQNISGWSSQMADDRPVSQCAFSPNSNLLLTGAWSGAVKLWSIPSCELITTLSGHEDRVGGVAFHPQSTLSLPSTVANMASSGGDGTVKLWSLDSPTPLATLEGHVGRVARIGFHPSGQYVGSAGFDGTWRLWDVVQQKELLLQEGHSSEVFALAFQEDGSLLATAGFDCVGRLWDLRTGRSTMALQGHIKDILGLDWSVNGYHLASASADNTVKIWDIRALRNIYTIPAHGSLVSDLKFAKAGTPVTMDTTERNPIYGSYLTTSSFDGSIKIFSADDYRLVKTLDGHDGKCMGLDISNDGRFIASTGSDRTFKLWADENMVL
ncbi:WD40 repeat-like protein [Hesseltinella vesiculosa]|uniref:WD40 repeat-like protein n=1 Tax=Hesseltinella vesiculosa TaxID=101127 RepID=A0A1X2GKP6_9FUNG|nr:WD40 repeat-like protein [Hesseltinella vesiculosa]